jgi:hypothetical protein
LFLVFFAFTCGPTFLCLSIIRLTGIKNSRPLIFIGIVGSIIIGLIVGVIFAGVYMIDAFSEYVNLFINVNKFFFSSSSFTLF